MQDEERATKVEIERGRIKSLAANRPLKYKIHLINGGYVKGIIPPNSFLEYLDNGEFDTIELVVDDECVCPLSLVNEQEDK
jgi:hypothetical protein